MNIIKKLIDKISGIEKEHMDKEIDDNVTQDRYLRSLRREHRIQMEEVEKEHLKKKIAEFKKAKERKYLWGITEKKINIAKKKAQIKQRGILSVKSAMFQKYQNR